SSIEIIRRAIANISHARGSDPEIRRVIVQIGEQFWSERRSQGWSGADWRATGNATSVGLLNQWYQWDGAISAIRASKEVQEALFDISEIKKCGGIAQICDAPLFQNRTADAKQGAISPEEHDLGIGFWRSWIQGFLKGQPIDWELQRRISLIPLGEWEKGPSNIRIRIDEVKAGLATDFLPQAEKLEFDFEKGKFLSIPIKLNASDLVETTLKQVEFAATAALKSNCGINPSATCCLFIQHALENCRSDPNAIEQNLDIAAKDIEEGIASGAYEADSRLSALRSVLERGVLDLRANHPAVAMAWKRRSEHIFKQLSDDQRAIIARKVIEIIEVSDEKLGEDFKLDAKVIVEGSTGEVQLGSLQRFSNRVGRMRLISRSAAVIKCIDESSGYKGTRIVQTMNSLVDLIVSLF
ncbi:hypothetical protein JMM63_18075, partial [Rhodovulum sulfidophilum]|uniref:hypothetical protein n=1 Tax=Rhodovulum sulfidophilum TaxID=35806 RepID=UPI001923B1F0